MANPLSSIRSLTKVLDELVELFHATPSAGAMQGVKANPALSMGANQGRGVYGYTDIRQAENHLGNLIRKATGDPTLKDFDHYGSLQKNIDPKYLTAEGIDPGIMRLLVPKKSLRFDVGSIGLLEDRAKDYIKRNSGELNELLAKRNIPYRGKGRFEGEHFKAAMLTPFGGAAVKRKSGGVSGLDTTNPTAREEEALGPIFDLLRGIDRQGYNEILEELLTDPHMRKHAAFRTLASPRGIRVA